MFSTTPNVIIFGEAGVGKSSLVNLILGADKAKVNANAGGCTFETTRYSVQIEGKNYNLYDTAGLGEANGGTVGRRKAIVNLYKLVSKLADTGGVNLLICVVKCGRLSHGVEKNYDMFHQAICEAKVPIVIVVTNCENAVDLDDPDQTMDSWWNQNEERFERAALRFENYACVCASRGRKLKDGTYSNDEPFEDSRGKVDALIHQCCLPNGWSKPTLPWFKRIVKNYFRPILGSSVMSTALLDVYNRLLRSHSDEEARQVIEIIENGV